MLTLTLAGNNLGWNSQCRCSVVAKGARYTGVYIGVGGVVIWKSQEVGPSFIALLYLCAIV
jgi:hypothetical protein